MKVALLVLYSNEFGSIKEVFVCANLDLAYVARAEIIRDRKINFPMAKHMHLSEEDFEIYEQEVFDEPQED